MNQSVSAFQLEMWFFNYEFLNQTHLHLNESISAFQLEIRFFNYEFLNQMHFLSNQGDFDMIRFSTQSDVDIPGRKKSKSAFQLIIRVLNVDVKLIEILTRLDLY